MWDANTNTNSYCHSNRNGDSYIYSNTDSDANADTNAYSYSNCDTNSDCYCYTDGDSDSYGYCNCNAGPDRTQCAWLSGERATASRPVLEWRDFESGRRLPQRRFDRHDQE